MLEVGEGQRDWQEPALSIHGSSVRDVKLIEASSVSFGDPEATSELYFSRNSERSVLGATGAELQATSQIDGHGPCKEFGRKRHTQMLGVRPPHWQGLGWEGTCC